MWQQVAAEAGRLLQQLVGRCVRLLFDERLLTALGDVIAVDDERSGGSARQDGARGQQRSLATLMQVTQPLTSSNHPSQRDYGRLCGPLCNSDFQAVCRKIGSKQSCPSTHKHRRRGCL